ncbi:mitochondrial ubiquinone biosynthesis Coq5 [Andalucia godoyi]|uniref:2-methoxy-6-polyprenyl-1,4-benzoquinol methylase, mitochondrial n=1 Tax=Andalucia godoyi TaxID=505711 RepID=A0A8K0F4N2_ANDGO|nr:mitochondrial ubiquinone biosynthesis Coq5 [Andalucia godoyi]|eukprot:ANDGO_03215.mRNA.1 mitochondrial ubiquinone biosynthesis Coq5
MLCGYRTRGLGRKIWPILSRRFSSFNGEGNANETTHFGFQQVPITEKKKRVGEVFHGVADRYDLMNDLMSGGIHRLWKDHFVSSIRPAKGMQILDVAGGTGDIAFRMVDRMIAGSSSSSALSTSSSLPDIPILGCISRMFSPLPEPPRRAHSQQAQRWSATERQESPSASRVVVSDINSSMLDVGRSRAETRGYISKGQQNGIDIDFQVADAESLPFADESFDVYTIAFGIRNCTKPEQVLKEAHRVLKKGGRFACLEFSRVDTPGITQLYDLFSFQVIPAIGQVVANDRSSYQYLVESIRQFPPQEEFLQMIRDAGFRAAQFENLSFGVAAIHSGVKL